MSTQNDGGPAFPTQPASGNYGPVEFGLSLRDYFAAKAMAAAISTAAAPYMGPDPYCAPRVAAMAYEMADSMLKAREGAA